MIKGFEIKNYQQHNFFLAVFNTMYAFGMIALARYRVLTPAHAQALTDLLGKTGVPVVTSLGLGMTLAFIFGWVSTNVLRLHDRVHEPHLVKWRAGYDTDYILRGLCYDLSHLVSPDLFERAYGESRVRFKMMQRLFYNFIGDSQPPYEGLRGILYTHMLKYWAFATLEIYCLTGLIGFSIYRIRVATDPFAWAVLIASGLYVMSRWAANRAVDGVRPVTTEQVHVIRKEQAAELESNLIAVADELGATRAGGVQ